MRGRSRAGSKPRRRKPAAPKRSSGTEAPRPRSSAAGGQGPECAQLARGRDEALEQLSAASDVLKIISSSDGELTPVFDIVLEKAVRLCAAKFGTMYRYYDNHFHPVALFGVPPAYTDFIRQRGPYKPPPGLPLHRLLQTRSVVHTIDQRSDKPQSHLPSAKLADARTHVAVPMLKDRKVIGAVTIFRQEVHPFTDKEIALVQNFAAQAVIAIENARLLNELRESLDRQTATADILRVIARTPEDSKHALDTIAETASHMFGVANVNFRRIEGDVLRVVSSAGPTIERLRKALPDIRLEATDPAVRCFLDNRQIPIE